MKDINIDKYPLRIRRLSKNEGGGYLIEFPDLPGCISDGETIEEAIQNGRDAVKCWLLAAQEIGREIPQPEDSQSGKWVQRVPKSMHLKLVSRAKDEGVSLNTLVVSFISEGIGKREGYEIQKSTSSKDGYYKIPKEGMSSNKGILSTSKIRSRHIIKSKTSKRRGRPPKQNNHSH